MSDYIFNDVKTTTTTSAVKKTSFYVHTNAFIYDELNQGVALCLIVKKCINVIIPKLVSVRDIHLPP